MLCGKINGSNATERVQSDHPVHGHTFQSFPPLVNGFIHDALLSQQATAEK